MYMMHMMCAQVHVLVVTMVTIGQTEDTMYQSNLLQSGQLGKVKIQCI